MASIASHVLFKSYNGLQTQTVMLEASYDPNGGCKGGLRYVRISPNNPVGGGTATGVYYVSLKNINSVKYNVTDMNDGNLSFDMKRVNYINAEIVSNNPATLGNSSISTAVRFDSVNNVYLVYVYDVTGLINVPANCRLTVSLTYTKYLTGGI